MHNLHVSFKTVAHSTKNLCHFDDLNEEKVVCYHGMLQDI